MRESLSRWVSDADALQHIRQIGVQQLPTSLAYQQGRIDDYYVSLVGELFDRMRQGYEDVSQWARLGNAFATLSHLDFSTELLEAGIEKNEPALFSATAFYLGGFPASAYVSLRGRDFTGSNPTYISCFDLLARPEELQSTDIRRLIEALRVGDMGSLISASTSAVAAETRARQEGPEEWVGARLLRKLLDQFNATCLRSVLPNGASSFWTPLISSFLSRSSPT